MKRIFLFFTRKCKFNFEISDIFSIFLISLSLARNFLQIKILHFESFSLVMLWPFSVSILYRYLLAVFNSFSSFRFRLSFYQFAFNQLVHVNQSIWIRPIPNFTQQLTYYSDVYSLQSDMMQLSSFLYWPTMLFAWKQELILDQTMSHQV
jgi:hypothetical protein